MKIIRLSIIFTVLIVLLCLPGCFVPVVQGLKAISASKNPPNYNNMNDANASYTQ